MEGPGDFYATVDVVDVVDGDTFRAVIDGEKVRVRIMGINSPESGGFREEEDWGAEAKAYARKKLEGRTVHLFTDPGDPAYDQYDRLLRYVDVDGVDAGLELVRRGLAIARYDSRDGYGFHPREPQYIAADRGSKPVCPTRPVGFEGEPTTTRRVCEEIPASGSVSGARTTRAPVRSASDSYAG